MLDAKAKTDDAERQLETTTRINAELQTELKALRRRVAAAEMKQTVAEARLAREKSKVCLIQKEKKNKSDLLRYHDGKKKNTKELATSKKRQSKLEEENAALQDRCAKLTDKVKDLNAEFISKEEELEKCRRVEEEGKVIVTCLGGIYSTKFRMLVFALLGDNVPHERLSNVIQNVLTFADKRASNLPTAKTIGKMNIERGTLAQVQIGVS